MKIMNSISLHSRFCSSNCAPPNLTEAYVSNTRGSTEHVTTCHSRLTFTGLVHSNTLSHPQPGSTQSWTAARFDLSCSISSWHSWHGGTNSMWHSSHMDQRCHTIPDEKGKMVVCVTVKTQSPGQRRRFILQHGKSNVFIPDSIKHCSHTRHVSSPAIDHYPSWAATQHDETTAAQLLPLQASTC